MTDYHETSGLSEGLQTYFPDWQNEELKRFTLEFYTKFAERYDNDPKLAFIQTGFGLWAEYHIYDGPCIVGKTFPDKEFQAQFFRHLDTTFKTTPWSVSIDAADTDLSLFQLYSNLKTLHFGLFDDSFLSEDHGTYNTDCWNFFDRKRYLQHPAGGEFSYYTDADQKLALSTSGPHNISFETDARNFHISYMIGNDQPAYQTMSRIKSAGLACGYKFKIEKFQASDDSSIVEVKNTGVAPLYYDAFVTINKVRAKESLRCLAPESTIVCHIAHGDPIPALTIECDRLIAGQKIEFEADLSATPVRNHKNSISPMHNRNTVSIYTPDGRWIATQRINDQYTRNNTENFIFSRYHISPGVYLIAVNDHLKNAHIEKRLFVK